MTWTKLSDDYSDDTWTLSDAAFRLHTEALVWSNRKLLDLRIPIEDLPRFSKTPQAVQELLDGGWWADLGDAYVIRHHGDYQRTREQVIKQQEANSKNGKKGGRPPAPKQSSNPVVNPVANRAANRKGQARTGQALEREQVPEVGEPQQTWPAVAVLGAQSCAAGCGYPLDPSLGETTHPTCDAAVAS